MKKISVVLIVILGTFVLISCSDFSGRQVNDPARTCLNCGPIKFNPFPKGYDPNAGDFSVEKMIASTGLSGIYPLVKSFLDQSAALTKTVASTCEMASPTDPLSFDGNEARQSWEKTVMAYHQLAAAPIGPVLEVGEPNLQSQIYSWPAINSCGIDLEVVRLSDQSQDLNFNLPVTVTGLAAIEYLLFDQSLGTQCNPKNPNHAKAFEWTKKSPAEKWVDRCRLLKPLTYQVNAAAGLLERYWDPNYGNFSKNLIDGSAYPNTSESLTALAHSLFALEGVKDQKLGKPLGVHKDCTRSEKKCPEAVEHSWSGVSVSAAVEQLKGLKVVFTGGQGRGFDDLLVHLGYSKVKDDLLQAIDQAVTNGNQLLKPGLLKKQIDEMDPMMCQSTTTADRKVPVCAFFQDVRQISIKMKTEFLSVLSIRQPPNQSGDND